jgi:YfiH family protein
VEPEFIVPDWPAPPGVRALQSTRTGGVSRGPYESLNLGDHVGDDPADVAANRARLAAFLPGEPLWLKQVHGVAVADALADGPGAEADAAIARQGGRVCVVMTADCLPLLLCDRAGTVVAAVHAGWRGLAAGVVEAAVAAMGRPGSELLAWLGPAIGPEAFEVGEEVRAAFLARDPGAAEAFVARGGGKWLRTSGSSPANGSPPSASIPSGGADSVRCPTGSASFPIAATASRGGWEPSFGWRPAPHRANW